MASMSNGDDEPDCDEPRQRFYCHDGFCGAEDCDRCHPGWWRRQEEEGGINSDQPEEVRAFVVAWDFIFFIGHRSTRAAHRSLPGLSGAPCPSGDPRAGHYPHAGGRQMDGEPAGDAGGFRASGLHPSH